jgi:hypothetical protein
MLICCEREKYCWLVAGGWFVLREKYCWLVADKPNEQGKGIGINYDLKVVFQKKRCSETVNMMRVLNLERVSV